MRPYGQIAAWIVARVDEEGYESPVAAFTTEDGARGWAESQLGPQMHGMGSREDPLGPNWTVRPLRDGHDVP